jgi:hypothetical protein
MQILVALHSLNRFVLLLLLVVVIGKSLKGWLNKSPFEKTDDKLSLYLFISTHTQLLLGLILYFFGSAVIFSGSSMKEAVARYWLVEHISGMLIAIVLISLGRILSKKQSESTAKYKRLFVYNSVALVIIVIIIGLSHRGFFSVSW